MGALTQLTQEFADNLKLEPLETQVMELIKVIDSSTIDVAESTNKNILMQFEDILIDLHEANNSVDDKNGDFYQLRVDYVVNKRNK
jgi:hypothetical protein